MKRNRRNIKRVLCAVMALAMIFVFAACENSDSGGNSTPPPATGGSSGDTGSDPASGEPQYGGTLRMSWDASADSKVQFGLPFMAGRSYNSILVPCFESLLLETVDGQYAPFLAEEWEAFPEKNEVVFKIRQGVKFHDGSDLTAEVVAWNFNTMFTESTILDKNYLSAEVRGENEVAVLMTTFQNTYLNMFSSHNTALVSKENYEKFGLEEAQMNPVGTGPFKFESVTPGQGAKFVRFDDYWQEGKPYVDAIEYIEITDTNTQVLAIQNATGDQAIDVLYCANVQQAGQLKNADGININLRAGGPAAFYPDSMNPDSPLSNKLVREAISYALDRDAIVAATGFGINTPAYQMVPEGFPAHVGDEHNAPGYDPEKAKALIAEAGYPDGFEMLLWTGTTTPGISQDSVEAMATMLRDVGIDAKTEYITNAEKNDREMTGWTGACISTIRPLPNITVTYRMKGWDPDFLYYPDMWRDVEGTRDLYKQATETPTVETSIVQELHLAALKDMVHIPVYDVYDAFAVKDYVRDGGFTDYGMGTLWRPDNVWIAQ